MAIFEAYAFYLKQKKCTSSKSEIKFVPPEKNRYLQINKCAGTFIPDPRVHSFHFNLFLMKIDDFVTKVVKNHGC